MNNNRKRVYYRPNKASGVIGGIIGGVFVLIGIFFAIPTFGVFGIFWTLIAAVIAGVSLYQAFGKREDGRAPFSNEIIIEDMQPEDVVPVQSPVTDENKQGLFEEERRCDETERMPAVKRAQRNEIRTDDVEKRLNTLQDLYDRRVISREEYEDKRRDILEDL